MPAKPLGAIIIVITMNARGINGRYDIIHVPNSPARNLVPSISVRPINNPPAIAPYMLKNPPTILAANMLGIMVFVLTLGIAAIIGSIMGLVSSYPGIRLRGDYLAIVLLALGEGIRIIGNNYAPLVGGSIGVHIPDPLSFLAGDLRFPIATIALGGIAAAVYLYVRRVTRSPLGRLLRSIRDDETAAEALGKNIKSARIRTIMMAAALAAVGGALYAFYVGSTIAFCVRQVELDILAICDDYNRWSCQQ